MSSNNNIFVNNNNNEELINNINNQIYINDQNNQINQNNSNNPNNPNNPNNKNFINTEQFKKFVGSNVYKNGYNECAFCGLYFPVEMQIGDSCGHCWAFCFSNNFDLTNCKYDGPHTLDQIKNYLKKTFVLHPKGCNNKECIYNKINDLYKQKKLNNELALLLGFDTNDKGKSNQEQRISNVNKKREVNINYKLSKISI
jgi:hypothetical protein